MVSVRFVPTQTIRLSPLNSIEMTVISNKISFRTFIRL